jgi:hypothetical protein
MLDLHYIIVLSLYFHYERDVLVSGCFLFVPGKLRQVWSIVNLIFKYPISVTIGT